MRVAQFLPVSGELNVGLQFGSGRPLDLTFGFQPRAADKRTLATTIPGFADVRAVDMLARSAEGGLSPIGLNSNTPKIVTASGYGAGALVAIADAKRGIALIEVAAEKVGRGEGQSRIKVLWDAQALARSAAVKTFAAAQGHTGKLSVEPLEIYLSTGFVDTKLITLVVKLAISSTKNPKVSEGSFSCFVSAVPGVVPQATHLEAGVRQRQGWSYPPSSKLRS